MNDTSGTPLSRHHKLLNELLATLGRHPDTEKLTGLITDYVWEGGNEDVFNTLRTSQIAWQLYQQDAMLPFQAFYRDAHQLPVPALLRWVQILGHCYGTAFNTSTTLPASVAPSWLVALIYHQSANSPSQMGVDGQGALPFEALAELYRAEQRDPQSLTELPFSVTWKGDYGIGRLMHLLRQIPGYTDALVQRQALLQTHLLNDDLEYRRQRLSLLTSVPGAQLQPLLAILMASATASNKDLRLLAQSLVLRCEPRSIYEQALTQLAGAKPELRAQLLQLAMQGARGVGETALIEKVRSLATADKSELVRVLTSQWDAEQLTQAVAIEKPVTDWANALTEGTIIALNHAQAALNDAIAQGNVQRRTYFESRPLEDQKKWPLQLLPEWSAQELQALCEAIKNPDPRAISQCAELRGRGEFIRKMVLTLAADPQISLPALLKTIRWFYPITHANGVLQYELIHSIEARFDALGSPDLLTLAVALIDMGAVARRIVHANVSRWGSLGSAWPSAATLPFFQAYLDEFAACFEPDTLSHSAIDRACCYRIFAELPEPRALVSNRLFDLALGAGKTERGPAQAALEGLAETPARVIAALADGKAEVRAQAAIWLARLRNETALPALEKAVRTEKNDIAKGAMLDALQRFGRPIAAYIDRSGLLKEAQKLLAKPLPQELHWMNWDQLPVVHWSDNGAVVEPEIVKFLIVQACKQKNPEPNAVLRKYCESFDPADRARFGEWLLGAWIAADSKPYAYDKIERQAQHYATSMHAMYQRTLPPDDPNRQRTLEQLHARYILNHGHTPEGTEIASKGVLAVAAACGSAAFVQPVARYLKTYYGTRAAQCKALMIMLAWVEHPSAIQLVLAIGKRFRTKGIQEEAVKQAQLLAERNDWTLDELADRTIPTGGLDDEGILELSYGERRFSAVLKADAKAGLKLELRNPDGKTIAALPEPRADDDAEEAAAAKKNLALAKKEIKTAVDLQSQRLYDAMCTARLWRFEDFDRYLNRHPVVGHLVQRLIWCTADGTCFRPMADGTLTDVEDGALNLDAATQVRIAHDFWLSAEQVKAWQGHCSDYQIKPLFQQFGKGRYQADDLKAKALLDANGVVMDNFNLRARMNKLGYSRGPISDGPGFDTYEKRLPTLGIVIELAFSGCGMPEENIKIAVLEMRFVRVGTAPEPNQVLPLSEVPPVLLAESHFDLKTLAADGRFDPKWQELIR